MQIEIICTGDEVLTGKIVNTKGTPRLIQLSLRWAF